MGKISLAICAAALLCSGSALAQSSKAAGKDTHANAQAAPATITGNVSDTTAVTGLHTGTNAGAGPANSVPATEKTLNGDMTSGTASGTLARMGRRVGSTAHARAHPAVPRKKAPRPQ